MAWSRDFLLTKNVESQLSQDLLSLHKLLFLSVRVVLTVLPQLSRLLLGDVFGVDLLLVVNILQNKLLLHLVFGSSMISSVFRWFLWSIQLILNFQIKPMTIAQLILLLNISDVYLLLLILLCALRFWGRSFGTMSILLLELTEIDVVVSILLSILFLLLHVFLVIVVTRLIVLVILIIVDLLTILHLHVLVIIRFKHLILVIMLLWLFFHS